jgi:phosphatidylserine decarboxylase
LSLHGLGNFRIPDSFAAFPELVSEWWRVFARHRANHWPRSRSKRAFVYFLLVWSHALKKYWTHFQQLLCCLA